MLALVLQAMGGPLPTDGEVWTTGGGALRSQAELATVGSCLRLING
jgi:hypothetical protein